LIIVGGVLGAVTGFIPFIILMLVGVFLFASVPSEDILYNYVLANTGEALLRKRSYIIFIPLMLISLVLTLGKATLLIPVKEEYFKGVLNAEGKLDMVRITRKEYKAILCEQRRIYSTQALSREFMESSYSTESIGLKRKKRRLTLASIFAILMLTMLTVPGGIYLTLIYEALFLPMILLWIPEYKDARIIQQAYDRAMSSDCRKSRSDV